MDSEDRKFKRAEMKAELSHEDTGSGASPKRAIDFKKFKNRKKQRNTK